MRLLRGVAAVFSALTLLIFAARWIGSIQPPPDGLAQLHLTECALPCWLGITPGVTPFDDAVQRVKAAYPTTPLIISGGQIFIQALVGFSGGAGTVQGQQGIVNSVTLDMSDAGSLWLGDVASVAGMPSCLEGNPPDAAIYSSPTVFAFVAGRDQGWQTALTNITILASRVDYCEIANR